MLAGTQTCYCRHGDHCPAGKQGNKKLCSLTLQIVHIVIVNVSDPRLGHGAVLALYWIYLVGYCKNKLVKLNWLAEREHFTKL